MVTQSLTTDGRIARRERNQDTVLDAVVALFESGDPDPAVEDVSKRSGVSTRSIYRYFHHRDGLINAALCHLSRRVDREVPLDVGSGPLDERIARFVKYRLDVYERLAPLTRASRRVGGGSDAAEAADPVAAEAIECDPFAHAAAVCFEAEFKGLPDEQRRQAEVASEMALQFESLEFLSQSFNGNRSSVAAVLARHLGQYLSAVAPKSMPIL